MGSNSEAAEECTLHPNNSPILPLFTSEQRTENSIVQNDHAMRQRKETIQLGARPNKLPPHCGAVPKHTSTTILLAPNYLTPSLASQYGNIVTTTALIGGNTLLAYQSSCGLAMFQIYSNRHRMLYKPHHSRHISIFSRSCLLPGTHSTYSGTSIYISGEDHRAGVDSL